jgi:hypothetical protein
MHGTDNIISYMGACVIDMQLSLRQPGSRRIRNTGCNINGL